MESKLVDCCIEMLPRRSWYWDLASLALKIAKSHSKQVLFMARDTMIRQHKSKPAEAMLEKEL